MPVFWRSDGDYPCVGHQNSRRENARRLSPSDLRTTLPDLCALAKRPPRKPTSRGRLAWIRRRSAARLFVTPGRRGYRFKQRAREGLAETQGGLGQAAQHDAGPGGAGRGETDARTSGVLISISGRLAKDGVALYQSRAHLSACLERQERRR